MIQDSKENSIIEGLRIRSAMPTNIDFNVLNKIKSGKEKEIIKQDQIKKKSEEEGLFANITKNKIKTDNNITERIEEKNRLNFANKSISKQSKISCKKLNKSNVKSNQSKHEIINSTPSKITNKDIIKNNEDFITKLDEIDIQLTNQPKKLKRKKNHNHNYYNKLFHKKQQNSRSISKYSLTTNLNSISIQSNQSSNFQDSKYNKSNQSKYNYSEFNHTKQDTEYLDL